MASSQNFFKPQQEKTMMHTTNISSNIHINGRADIAVAVFLIDHLRTTTHQKKQQLADVLLKPLLNKLQENTSCETPSVGYLTPIKYLQQLCLETEPNILVSALADVLSQLTLDYIRQNPREFAPYFLNITPHTLSEQNIESNPRCLNPMIPVVISHIIKLPFDIYETSDNKTLPKKYPHSNSIHKLNTSIKLHWQGGECLASVNILDTAHFKNINNTLFPPRTPLIAKNIQQQKRYVLQEMARLTENYRDTKQNLNKYIKKENLNMLKIYFDYLNQNKHTHQSPTDFGVTHGTQKFYQSAVTDTPVATHGYDRDEKLKQALTRLLISGEQLNIRGSQTEKNESPYAAPAA